MSEILTMNAVFVRIRKALDILDVMDDAITPESPKRRTAWLRRLHVAQTERIPV